MLVSDYVVEERFSAWQKKRVRTIIVNSRSKISSQRSINGALAIAKPYDRIELVGGEYFETLSVSFPLEIVAAEGEDPRVVSRGSCLTITQSVEAYFEHVEFISKGKGKLEASVALLHGSSVFFRCKMNSMIIGGLATPHIERCTITESYNGVGIQINDNAGAILLNSIIHTHHLACADIDTRGVVTATECNMYQPANGGHVVAVRAVQSFSGGSERAPAENLSCRQVTFSRCNLYMTANIFRPKDREGFTDGFLGAPSCVLISHGACPVFKNNELLEGQVGFTFEFAGSATLQGNVIRNQRSCGVLVLVDDVKQIGDTAQQNLCITGGNLIDRCFIGIDVHCKGRGGPRYVEHTLVSDVLPSGRTSFDWFTEMRKIRDAKQFSITDDTREENVNIPIHVNGQRMMLKNLKEDLCELANFLFGGHPRHFYAENADARSDGVALSSFGSLLADRLGLKPPGINYSSGVKQMQRLRGNFGVDILETRFTGCDLCAIRFGSNGYGLVEDCDFVNCGATAIVVHSGAHPVIIGCKLEHSKGAGILLDSFANPIITANEIHHGIEHGIEIRNMARGIIMGNVISANNTSGLFVSGGSTTIIAANTIEESRSAGVAISEGSRPFLIWNKFIANVTTQVLVAEFSTPFIANNEFTSSPNAALHFESCGGGTVVNNNIIANGEGIVVELDADPCVKSNKIEGSLRYGILVRNNGMGTFLENEIKKSSICNVYIKEGGSPLLRNNSIREGHGGGVVVVTEGSGCMEHNTITENAVGNVIVIGRFSEPVFKSNIISSSMSGCGIICAREGCGFFTGNRIFHNTQCGVYVIGKANPTFLSNVISRETVGIIVSDSGRGTFEKNEIHSSHGTGIIIQLDGDPVLLRNRVSKCVLSGLLVAPEGYGKVTENEFFENDVGVQLGSTLGTAELDVDVSFYAPQMTPVSAAAGGGGEGTSFSSTKGSSTMKLLRRASLAPKALEIKQRGNQFFTVDVRRNRIYSNITCGVLLESDANGTVEENIIESNESYGVMADVGYSGRRADEKLKEGLGFLAMRLARTGAGGGNASVCKNRIFAHKCANVAVINHPDNKITIGENEVYDSSIGFYMSNNGTFFSIKGNNIRDCYDGVFSESGGRGKFEDNKIHNCYGVGVYVSQFGCPEFTNGNIIERCRVAGVLVDAGGKGIFTQAEIRHCPVGVIVHTCPPVSSIVRQEDFMRSESATSAPTFEKCTIEQNDQHGVLVLTVGTGYLLRQATAGSPAQHQKAEGFVNAPGASMFPLFRKNIIRRNRLFGICHENFDVTNIHRQIPADEVEVQGDDHLARHGKRHRQRNTPRAAVEQTSLQPKNSHQEALGISTILASEEHHKERMRRQTSFVENTITDCSIGVVVGGNCHPFLLRNYIQKNTFFGVLLRSESKAVSFGCEASGNGIAGLYAAPGSFGSFANGSLNNNNGFCRPSLSPNEPRTFANTLPILQSPIAPFSTTNSTTTAAAAAASASLSISASIIDNHNSFAAVVRMMDNYVGVAVDGLRMLFELVAASSSGLSLGALTAPSAVLHTSATSCKGLFIEGYDRSWAADGGIGAWIVMGSMFELNSTSVKGNRNIGVYYSRGAPQQHSNVTNFFVEPYGGFPSIVISQKNMGGAWGEKSPRYLFTSAAVSCTTGLVTSGSPIRTRAGGSDSFCLTSSEVIGDSPFILRRPATIRGNRITGNSYGVLVQLFHVLRSTEREGGAENACTATDTGPLNNNVTKRASGAAKRKASRHFKAKVDHKSRKPLTTINKSSDSDSTDAASPRLGNAVVVIGSGNTGAANAGGNAEKPFGEFSPSQPSFLEDVGVTMANFVVVKSEQDSNTDFTVIVEENHVHENSLNGIVCQHVVEVLTENNVRARSSLEEAAKAYGEICAQISLRKDIPMPKIPFGLVPHERMIRHAKVSGNEVYKNGSDQLELSSRYVAILEDGTRILLQLDTLASPQGSMCSSYALLKISLYAALTQQAPPGLFLIENNRFYNCVKGVHVLGLLGCDSSRFRHNAFFKITGGPALLVEGHLASTTVGNGNVFEENETAISVVLLKGTITEIEKRQLKHAGIITCVYSNRFVASKQSSVIVQGGGGVSPLFYGNEFTGHMSGSAAFFVEGASTKACIMKNTFAENFVPFIVTNRAGAGEGGSLIVESNRFVRNYIGMFVCGGAAPRLSRNIFEANYRSGLEIADTTTSPSVRHCIFIDHKLQETSKAFAPPEGGKLILTGMKNFAVDISPGNRSNFDETSSLPAGIILGAEGAGLISECLFSGNDIGVDVARVPVTDENLARGTCFSSCLFTNSSVTGVLVRGPHGISKKLLSSRTAAGGGASAIAIIDPSRLKLEATVFDRCFFAGNVSDPNRCGDVVSVDGGYALFRKSFFTGCIHGFREGAAHFHRNILLSSYDVGVYMHKSTRLRLEGNTIRGQKTAIVTDPGAWGHLEGNWILDVTRGVVAAPFSHTLFVSNHILMSKDCGILAFGGVFSENEVCGCPTGIILQNPCEFKNYHSIPEIEKTAFDVLLSGNVIHSCEVDGILLAGGGRVEENRVYNCKQNLNIICPSATGSGSTAATVSKNFFFDGEIGVVMAKGSAFVLCDNEIFDNSMLGVWCKMGATGVLQGNNISSSLKDGALDLVPNVDVKVLQNTIRNQFSPSYQKTLPAQRIKDRQEASEQLAAKVRRIDDAIEEMRANREQLETGMQRLLESIRNSEETNASLGNPGISAAVSRILRHSIADQSNSMVDVLETTFSNSRRYSLDILRANRTDRSSISGIRARKSVDRRLSEIFTTRSTSSLTYVLIHVMNLDKNTLESTQLGKEVESLFCTEPLASRASFRPVITTNASALASFITAQTPNLMILVVGNGKDTLGTEEISALRRLENVRRPSMRHESNTMSNAANGGGGGGGVNNVFKVFTLLPHEWKSKVDGQGSFSAPRDMNAMSLETFASKHNPMYYTFALREALEKMVQDLLLLFPLITEPEAPEKSAEAKDAANLSTQQESVSATWKQSSSLSLSITKKPEVPSLPTPSRAKRRESKLEIPSITPKNRGRKSLGVDGGLPKVKGLK